MTRITADAVPAKPAAARHSRTTCRRSRVWWLTSWTARRGLTVVVALAGTAVLLFPMGMDWFNSNAHAATITTYAQNVANTPSAAAEEQLAAARAYNDALPSGGLSDPFSAGPDGSDPALTASQMQDYQQYESLLNPGGDGTMGVLSVPKIGLGLPIFHGSGPTALNHGVGHLYGSALPVGGPSTHSVLTGHSGIPGDTLFTNLHQLVLGDTFSVVEFNEVLTYQVDQIRTVVPDDLSPLAVVPGMDYMTLVTCTPIGINSHRLLVRGARVPTSKNSRGAQAMIAKLGGGGFPMWLLYGLGALLGSIVLSAPMVRHFACHPHSSSRHKPRRNRTRP
jgi:sortase A